VARNYTGNTIWPNSFSCAPGSFDITVSWAANQSGRLSLVKSGGSGGGGGGGGGGTWGTIAGTLSDQADLQSVISGLATSTHTHSGAAIVSGFVSSARLGSGTANTTTFLRGDGTWATPAGGGGSVSSVFGRSGAVAAAANDYNFNQLAGALQITQINTTGTANATTFLRGDGQWAIPSGSAGGNYTFNNGNVGTGLVLDAVNLSIDTTVVAALGSTQTFTGPKTFTGNLAATGAGANVDFTNAATARVAKQGVADPVCDGSMAGSFFINTNANPWVLKVCGKNSGGSYVWGVVTVAGW
jgi:hypothetical protein